MTLPADRALALLCLRIIAGTWLTLAAAELLIVLQERFGQWTPS